MLIRVSINNMYDIYNEDDMARNKPTTTISLEKTTLELLDKIIPSRENRSNFIEDMILAVIHSETFYKQLKRAHALIENDDIFETINELLDDGSKDIIKRNG